MDGPNWKSYVDTFLELDITNSYILDTSSIQKCDYMEEKIRRFQKLTKKLTKISKNIFQLPGGKSLKSSSIAASMYSNLVVVS